MDKQEQQSFFYFLIEQFNKSNQLYIEDNSSFYFWGYDNLKIAIHTTGNMINYSFSSEDSNHKSHSCGNVEISFKNSEPFLDYIYSLYLQQYKKDMGTYYTDNAEFIEKTLKYISEYMQNITFLHEVDENSILFIPNEDKSPSSKQHMLRLGRLLSWGAEKQTYLTGIIKVPLTLYKPDSSDFVQLDFLCPNWKIKEYSCLDKFVHINSSVQNLEELIIKFKEQSLSLGSMLQYHILDNLLPQKYTNPTINKKKI